MKTLHMKENSYPGYLITFCGLDGCGKTSMIRRLAAYLEERGIHPALTKQPTDAVRQSSIFRAYMDSPDHRAYSYRSLSLLAASDRLQHTEKEIEPILREGGYVISDRYFYSCLANLRARGFLDDGWIYEIVQYIQRPSISFFLDVPVEVAVERVRQREDEKDRYIDIELQYWLRQEYLQIAQAAGGIIVRTDEPEEKTFGSIIEEVEKKVFQGGKQYV